MYNVNVVLSDRAWILERLGHELQTRLPGVALADAADPAADINYYITFACRRREMPTLEMGLFTHMEQTPELQELFVSTARDLDLAVCMSAKYRDALANHGVTSTVLIPPGVDLGRFEAKLRIGVVGRAYHTGRKGEGLVAQLMDMEGIDWHFTGTGWPQPGRFVPEEDLPDFYRSLDYVLVPALYEGGPMCVPEALAVGTPVIASDVGWVREFPHIPFKTGDASDLRRVLDELLEQKRVLRESTRDYTWDAYAEAHDAAFRGLIDMHGTGSRTRGLSARPPVRPVRLLLHGDEATTLGGPSVRVPRTAAALNDLGYKAAPGSFSERSSAADVPEDLVHVFNVWNPSTALRTLRHMRAASKTVVFSPIYLDLSERAFWHGVLPHLDLSEPAEIAAARDEWISYLEGRGRLSEAVPGYHSMVREMMDTADHVVFLSAAERQALAGIGARVEDDRCSLVHNPVDATRWRCGDPETFREAYLGGDGPQDYVLCIGRIEPRKNQLMLARAMRDLRENLRLVLVGHVDDQAYAARIREEAGDRLIETGRLEFAGEMMLSALSGARVFCLPSWAEGASLAALEAAANGCNMVISDRSSEIEYFGDMAEYCDPGDLHSIHEALDRALAYDDPKGRGAALAEHVAREHSWQRYSERTVDAYRKALAAEHPGAPRAASLTAPTAIKQGSRRIALDVTTLAHHQGRITGISRVESTLAKVLPSDELDADVKLVFWHDKHQRYLEMPRRFAQVGHAFRYRARFDEGPAPEPVTLAPDTTILMGGSAWMQNERYVRGLEILKSRNRAALHSIIYDLIPLRFPFWFEDDYAPVFRRNFGRLVQISDHFYTDSVSCAKDLEALAAPLRTNLPDITPIRLGDPILMAAEEEDDARADGIRTRFADTRFVLAVGAIHARKNYDMLYRVWTRFADEGRCNDLHLVIVGGVSWNGKDMAARIAKDFRVSKRIHVLSGVDDLDLGWLYERCLFTVFPSHYEGWGLPVAESLVHRKLCLATSSSSVTEIAPDLVEHIDPEDFVGWHAKIIFYAQSKAARDAKEAEIAKRYTPVRWEDTADQIVAVMREARQVSQLDPLRPGQRIEVGTDLAPNQIAFGDGWHLGERFFRWSAVTKAGFRVRIDPDLARPDPNAAYLLALWLSVFGKRVRRLEITVSGEKCLSQDVSEANCPKEILLAVSPTLMSEDGTVEVEISMPALPEKNGERNLGLGLKYVGLIDPSQANPLHVLEEAETWADPSERLRMDLTIHEQRNVVAQATAYSPAWGVGSQSGEFVLRIPILPNPGKWKLRLDGRAVATSREPVSARFLWNDAEIGSGSWSQATLFKMVLELPPDAFSRHAPSFLTVEHDGLKTPAELGTGSSEDITGLGLFELHFIEHAPHANGREAGQ